MDIERGSEWRRWDLHMHTPFTKKNDRFKGQTAGEKWDSFYSDIMNYVGDGSDPTKAVCAVAITDYVSIDNYMKVRSDKRLPDCVKLVLPNVELRMTPVAKKSPINIHCIFNPDIADELEGRFFSKLKMANGEYTASKSELMRLGRKSRPGDGDKMKDDDAVAAGISQFVISYESLAEIINVDRDLRNNMIIVLSDNDGDGAFGALKRVDYLDGDKSQLEATVSSIYKLSDMIFSSNTNERSFFLGEGGKEQENDIIKKFGSLKPCVHGCDAHCNEEIFSPHGNRYCWIKADPTFEGLKQVIYEPKDRVHIGEMPPDSKPGYNVIDRVEISDSDWFSPEPIYFSENLTCIIGGKSTGKSVLLHNIAMAVDGGQVENEVNIARSNVRKIEGFSVFWRDGKVSSAGNDSGRNVVYIPQSYLNKLSDSRDGASEIEKIVRRVIMQDAGCAELESELRSEVGGKKREIAGCIAEFIGLIGERKELTEEYRQMGDEEGIRSEIERLTVQSAKLTRDGITEDEIETYQDSLGKKRELEIRRDGISKEIDVIEKTQTVVDVVSAEALGISVYAEWISTMISDVKKCADEEWCARREKILKQAHADYDDVCSSIRGLDSLIDVLKPKMDSNELAKHNAEMIAGEKAKLNSLEEIKGKLRKNGESYEEHLKTLGDAVRSFGDIYARYAESLNGRRTSESGDIEISAKSVFQKAEFEKMITDIIDNRTLSGANSVFKLDDVHDDGVCPEKMIGLIKAVTSGSEGSLKIKKDYGDGKGNVADAALNDIINDWYKIDYEVIMDGDDMQSMSPGKKALVLLKFFICMSDNRCPILIDQPEDDLDNRSIYDELVGFMREKKIQRQIIVVTHNANIVVGADAELVIVANQGGKNSRNEKYRIEYRGGAIENNKTIKGKNGILNSKGIRDHICEILEGGGKAFSMRQHKYCLDGR